MNREAAMRWVADLRANPEAQGKGRLQTEDGKQCCLGRLCLLQGATMLVGYEDDEEEGYIIDRLDFNGEKLLDDLEQACVPNPIARIIEAKTLGEGYLQPTVTINGETYEDLATANDKGCTFAQIADWIEQNYERL